MFLFDDQTKVCCWLEGDSDCSQFIFVIDLGVLETILLQGSVVFFCVIVVVVFVVVVVIVVVATIVVLIDFHVLTLQRILRRRKNCF